MNILKTYTSPNYDARPEGMRIKYIIVHYTEFEDAKTALTWLCDPKKKVSAHYLICKTGTCYQMVDDEKRAWHAGVSQWGADENLNHSSIGIELDNNGQEPFAEAQMDTLLALLEQLCAHHPIPRANVLGHEDIAPGRKVDPGPYFPWHILYQQGFANARILINF